MKIEIKTLFRTLLLSSVFVLNGVSASVFANAHDTENKSGFDDSFINYQDIFNLEYASNPVIMPDGKTVLYERNSMDIMVDAKRTNLWTVSLDGSNHMPLLSSKDSYSNAVFSPNGSKMAYFSNKEGKRQIYLRDMVSGNTSRVTDVELRPNSLSFSPSGKWLAFAMFTPSKPKSLFSLSFKPEGATWAEDAHYIDQTLFQRDGAGMNRPGNMQVYVVPSFGGTPRQITSGDFDYGGQLMWTQSGSHIVMSANIHENSDFDILNSDLLSVNVKDGSLTKLTDTTGPESNPALSPNGDKIAFTGFDDNGKSSQINHLFVMDTDGANVKDLTPELDRSVSDVQWSKNGKGLYFSYDDAGKKHVAYVTLSGKLTVKTDALGGLSLGRPYTSGDYDVSDDGEIVFTLSTGVRPADLAVLSKRGKVIQLTDLNSDIFGHKTLNKPELMKVNSSVDERELLAWIVKPPKFDPAKKYPLILEIHGGPHTAYGPEFSTEVQMFAAAGYVVIYGNPRGSTSMGTEFANLIDKNYPSEDYNDLMDMVDGVIAKGYIDESNLFVTGGSGGGVLTAWIIGKTDRFAAAVVAKPVINWISMIGTSDIYTFMTKYWFTDFPWNDVNQYWDRSPLRLVGNVTTPTMVLTGELDVRTPMGESEQYYGALRLEGVESSLVRIQGAYHGIAAKPSNLSRKIGYILAWFDKYKKMEEE
jgi:dipeptidyl aminopeptidase/acylaminoacyl peptidase